MRTVLRQARLRGDQAEMAHVRCPFIDWRSSGDPPEVYLVHYHLPSYVQPGRLRTEHAVLFSLPASYPLTPPVVRMVEGPPAYHPNVFPDGRVCLGTSWNPEEPLGFLVIRVARMLLYHKDVTNPLHPANAEAAGWYTREAARLPLGGAIVFPDPLTRAAGERRPLTITRKWKNA